MPRSIQLIRAQIQVLRGQRMKWKDVCEMLNILTVTGEPDYGLAFRIANGRDGQEYEPTDPDVRRRLGLSAVCPTCRRRMMHKHEVQEEVELQPDYMKWWRRLSTTERHAFISYLHEKHLTQETTNEPT